MTLEFVSQASKGGVGLRGLSVVGEEIAWASGTGGSFARTADGGASWSWGAIRGYESLDFRSIKAFDDRNAVVASAGAPATILLTDDGGASWREAFRDATGRMFLDAMAFRDRRSGLALGDPLDDGRCVLRTRDSGASWSRVPPEDLPDAVEGESHFAASGTCLAAFGDSGLCFVGGGSVARAYWSDDDGASWRASDLPLIRGKPSRGAFSVAALDGARACVVGGDYASPELCRDTAAYTEDGGRSWKASAAFPPGGYNSCVAYLPGTGGRVVIATGTQGSHLSEDGGMTWASVDPAPFNVIAFAESGGRGWAAGTDGRICAVVAR
ncbi:MAG: hypothetical protein KKA67_04595 [Spirochaetes bacterium]|nr:hypothetical protein [Spirochaetota bacterium]MBU1081048.1 hypothetical protein [Spirochaetota bacterium]